MTQVQFDGLPGLLSPSQFIAVTGLSREKLRLERESGGLPSWTGAPRSGRKRTYRKYYKRDAGKLAGFVVK
jgi:hypothetical protein